MITLDELVRAIVREELEAGSGHPSTEPAAYSIAEVAELLSCSRRHVYDHLLRKGRLRTIKVGRRVLVPSADVHALLDEAI